MESVGARRARRVRRAMRDRYDVVVCRGVARRAMLRRRVVARRVRRDETYLANTPVLLLSASLKNGIDSERKGARWHVKRSMRGDMVLFLVRQPLTVSECQDSSPDCAPWVSREIETLDSSRDSTRRHDGRFAAVERHSDDT